MDEWFDPKAGEGIKSRHGRDLSNHKKENEIVARPNELLQALYKELRANRSMFTKVNNAEVRKRI